MDGIWDKSIGKVSVGNRRYFEMYTVGTDFARWMPLCYVLSSQTIDSKTNEIFSLVHFSFFFLFYNLIINFEL